jgi:hypothetical protein
MQTHSLSFSASDNPIVFRECINKKYYHIFICDIVIDDRDIALRLRLLIHFMKFSKSIYIIWTSVMRPSIFIGKIFWSGYRFYLLIIVTITYKDKANY